MSQRRGVKCSYGCLSLGGFGFGCTLGCCVGLGLSGSGLLGSSRLLGLGCGSLGFGSGSSLGLCDLGLGFFGLLGCLLLLLTQLVWLWMMTRTGPKYLCYSLLLGGLSLLLGQLDGTRGTY